MNYAALGTRVEMPMPNLINRITGITRGSPPDDQPVGLWCKSDGTVWCGEGSEGHGIPDTLLPKPHFEEALLAISKSIDLRKVCNWHDWCIHLPVDSSVGDSLVEKREEAALGQAIPHLQEICRNPRSHLKVSEFREPVSRARRIPPRAISLLSAHSEDWHSRTFRSVRPKMVLSEVTEDELAIYENRALRTLRERILEALTPRLLALRDLLTAIELSSQGEVGGYRFRIDRLCHLLDQLFSKKQDRDQLGMLVERLTSIHKSLLGLGGTSLLKDIRQSSPVSSPLHATNILRDDKRYRNIYALWHLWERKDDEKISRGERLRRLSSGMDRYVAILCARAFGLLNMVHEGSNSRLTDSVFKPGSMPVELKRGWTFGWNENGTFVLRSPVGEAVLMIVAIAAQVDRLPVELIDDFAAISEDAAAESPPVLLLSLGNLEESPVTWSKELVAWRERQRHTLVNIPGLLLLEVSPSRLDPVEHVARVIRRVIAQVEWPELPVKIVLPRGFAAVYREISQPIGESFARAPSAELLSEVTGLHKVAGEAIVRITEKLDEIGRQIQRGKSGPHARELAQEKSRLQSELKIKEGNLVIWRELLDELNRLTRLFAPVMICPCCGETTKNSAIASMFSCSSDSCSTRWGKRRDANGNMHVFLMPNGEDASNTQQDPLDRFGADFI
jgi:hypothetical protein